MTVGTSVPMSRVGCHSISTADHGRLDRCQLFRCHLAVVRFEKLQHGRNTLLQFLAISNSITLIQRIVQ